MKSFFWELPIKTFTLITESVSAPRVLKIILSQAFIIQNLCVQRQHRVSTILTLA